MNKLALFFRLAMSRIKATPIRDARPNSNRAPKMKRRGYYVNGERVYYRPAAPFIKNIAGRRYENGNYVDRLTVNKRMAQLRRANRERVA